MQVLPFVSGVPYELSQVPVKWQWILSINPITSVIAGWRWASSAPRRPTPVSSP